MEQGRPGLYDIEHDFKLRILLMANRSCHYRVAVGGCFFEGTFGSAQRYAKRQITNFDGTCLEPPSFTFVLDTLSGSCSAFIVLLVSICRVTCLSRSHPRTFQT